MKLTMLGIAAVASFAVCLAQMPLSQISFAPVNDKTTNSEAIRIESTQYYPILYHDTVINIKKQVDEAQCPSCNRSGALIRLIKYEWIEDLYSCIERYTWDCLICGKHWQKDLPINKD